MKPKTTKAAKQATLYLYQVVQDIDHLRGVYLVSAVVVASSRREARQIVKDRVGQINRSHAREGDPLVFERARVAVRRLGHLSENADTSGLGVNDAGKGPILSFATGEDREP